MLRKILSSNTIWHRDKKYSGLSDGHYSSTNTEKFEKGLSFWLLYYVQYFRPRYIMYIAIHIEHISSVRLLLTKPHLPLPCLTWVCFVFKHWLLMTAQTGKLSAAIVHVLTKQNTWAVALHGEYLQLAASSQYQRLIKILHIYQRDYKN